MAWGQDWLTEWENAQDAKEESANNSRDDYDALYRKIIRDELVKFLAKDFAYEIAERIVFKTRRLRY